MGKLTRTDNIDFNFFQQYANKLKPIIGLNIQYNPRCQTPSASPPILKSIKNQLAKILVFTGLPKENHKPSGEHVNSEESQPLPSSAQK